MPTTKLSKDIQTIVDGFQSGDRETVIDAFKKAAPEKRALAAILTAVQKSYMSDWENIRDISPDAREDLNQLAIDFIAMKAPAEYWDAAIDHLAGLCKEHTETPEVFDNTPRANQALWLLAYADNARALSTEQQIRYISSLIPLRDTSGCVSTAMEMLNSSRYDSAKVFTDKLATL